MTNDDLQARVRDAFRSEPAPPGTPPAQGPLGAIQQVERAQADAAPTRGPTAMPADLLEVLSDQFGTRREVMHLCEVAGQRASAVPNDPEARQLWTALWRKSRGGAIDMVKLVEAAYLECPDAVLARWLGHRVVPPVGSLPASAGSVVADGPALHVPPYEGVAARAAPPLVFVAHAKSDASWAALLREHLSMFELGGRLSVWSGEVRIGEDPEERLRAALEAAEVAVLIVSPAFLGDPALCGRALSRLRERSVPLLPLPARRCPFAALSCVGEGKLDLIGPTGPKPATPWEHPLQALGEGDQAEVLAALAERLIQLLDERARRR